MIIDVVHVGGCPSMLSMFKVAFLMDGDDIDVVHVGGLPF